MVSSTPAVTMISCHQFGRAVIAGLSEYLSRHELYLNGLITLNPESGQLLVGPRYSDFAEERHNFTHYVVESNARLIFSDAVRNAVEDADIILVVGWPRLIGVTTLDLLAGIPERRLLVGFHPSALPYGRGQSPVSWTILEGLRSASVTAFDLEATADTGPVRVQIQFDLDVTETATSLYGKFLYGHKLAAAELVHRYRSGILGATVQDTSLATNRRLLGESDLPLPDQGSGREAVRRHVRAFMPPYQGASLVSGEKVLFHLSRQLPAANGGSGFLHTTVELREADEGVTVATVDTSLYNEICKELSKMENALLDAGLQPDEPSRAIDRRYAGTVLRTAEGHVILQERDQKPGIVNPGGLTLFGGVIEAGESDVQGAVRELQEELALVLEPDNLQLLGFVDKMESDGSITRCAIYQAQPIEPGSLVLNEGKSIVCDDALAVLGRPNISAVCRLAVMSLVDA